MFKKIIVIAIFLIVPLLVSCSKVANTVNGLSTFQSTIAGSNYPFSVDKDGKLNPSYLSVDAEKLITNGDHFSINLDSLFLRYLQASDPYIVVYSEAWMGSEVRPTDDKLLQRQIILLKDGEGFNSRLPISWIPLLGPVTMEEDSLDVYVSLNVVVLSKNDNKQTTELLDGLASVAGTAAPQYALVAGAAASIGKAIVAQNRDKVEFEHTFNLSPKTGLKQIFKANDSTGPIEPPLAESKLVVIKGENENRLVPYNNWFHYIWPFNWLGHKPNNNSLRFETAYQNYKRVSDVFSGLFLDEGASYTIVNIPFKALSFFLIPDDSFWLEKKTTSPDKLTMEGGYLMSEKANKPNEQAEIDFIHRLYSEKTHVILSIKKTDGSYGNFNQLKEKFSTHAEQLNNLLSDNSSSDTAIQAAFDSIEKAVLYEKKRKKVIELAKSSAVGQSALNDVISTGALAPDDQASLTNIFWKELSVQSGKRLKSRLDNILMPVNLLKPNPTDFFNQFYEAVDHEKSTYWAQCKSGIESERSIYWTGVLQAISDYLYNNEENRTYSQQVTNPNQFNALQQLTPCI